MTSFAPGSKSSAKRMIQYNTLYNNLNANTGSLFDSTNCECIPEHYNKTKVGTHNSSIKEPIRIRISRTVNTYSGGKLQYGDTYLNKPLQLNYFGRVEGMPGGYGSPPLNKF